MKDLHHRMKMLAVGLAIIMGLLLIGSWGAQKTIEMSKPITNALEQK